MRFQRGLHLPELDLWLDPWDAKPWAFVSHAHADHFARHDSALCSDVTAALVHTRFHLAESRIAAVSFHVPVVRDGFRLRLLPAGHITGSAMLHVTRLKDNASLLYTGDFKTRRGRTSEAVNFLTADTLILETTFGLPAFEFPNAMEIEAGILRFIQDAFADGETPVLLGYSLGKAQEALALVTEHGIPALLHPTVAAMTVACRAAGVETLPEPLVFDGHAPPGHVVIAPPNAIRSKLLRGLKAKRTAMLTGWALQPGSKYRYRVDEVFPLSDHADHPGLLECVKRVRPKRILTVHGYVKEFAGELRAKGMDAWSATGNDQLELSMNQAAQRSGSSGGPRHSRAICALADGTLFAVSWASRRWYRLDTAGRILEQRSTPSRWVDLQDIAHVTVGIDGERVVATGVGGLQAPTGPVQLGGLVVIDVDALTIEHDTPVAAWMPSGRIATYNGAHLVLDDAPSVTLHCLVDDTDASIGTWAASSVSPRRVV